MKLKLVLPLLLFLILLGVIGISQPKPVAAGYWTIASNVAYTHNEPWYEPHYGAYFSGSDGSSQYYTGSSGEPSGYGSWNWWGDRHHVLLLSKTWLFNYSGAWVGSNHHALMQ